MIELLRNDSNNQTQLTDTELVKIIWQGLQGEYRTLIGVVEDADDVKKDAAEDEESENV